MSDVRAELRAHGRVLGALRETQLELKAELRETKTEMIAITRENMDQQSQYFYKSSC